MSEQTFTAYVTKYALTQGILEITAKHALVKDTTIVDDVRAKFITLYYKPFWYLTRQEAVDHANSLVQKKLTSLRKQLKKTEQMRFFA